MAGIEMTVKLHDSDRHYGGSTFGESFNKRLDRFEKTLLAAEAEAAKKANAVTTANAKSKRPPVPMRPGRETTGGNFARHMAQWKPTAGGGVEFDMRRANQRAPYWVIQEVGTGHTATMKVGDAPAHEGGRRNRPGRQRRGTTQVTIPKQYGRRLPSHLAFGSGGIYSPFDKSRRDEGLFLRSSLSGAPIFAGKARSQVMIRREIEGKHFVRDGGKEGFRQYRKSLLAAAKASLTKPKWP